MTYSQGGLIQATDYNGFVSTTSGANVNGIWSTGTTDAGYGQSALGTVSAAGTVTATQWASLVNTISSIASHQGTSITARSAPVAGNTIDILTALNTDLTNCTNNRGNAVANGTQVVTWSGTSSKTTDTTGAFTITFTHTITFASADAARYFFNAGGRIKWETNKTSTGNLGDAEWNDLANTLVGDIYITGGTATQTISGSSYTGTTKSGGTGTPNTLATTTGWYDLTTSDTLIYKQFADTAPYTANFISINAKTAGSGTQLVLTTAWSNSEGDTITGGTATDSPLSSFGTAPATVVTYFPPSTTYLTTASWGTPTVAAAVS
jgi:hypothetical protein